MGRFYKKKSFKILIAVVIALLLLILHTSINGSFILSNLFGLSVPMQSAGAAVAESVSDGISDAAQSYDDLKAENEKLKQEINSLNDKLSDYYDYKQENEELKNYLELKSDNPDYQMLYGNVVQRGSADTYYSFKVDKGSSSGVQVHDPVITEEGLVGWVSSVSTMYCDVTTILSPETNISAMDKASRDSGVLNTTAELADSGLVRLAYLEQDQKVEKGDMIVTSGIGGYFPKNLKIGKAVEVKSSETDVSLYATVEPYADVKNVKSVMIITDFEGQGEAASSEESSE